MKRIGFLYEKFLSLNNFIKAEALLQKNKPKNKKAKHISANADKYGAELLEEYKQGYVFSTPREKTIHDNYKGKTRGLKIPCLKDQAVQLAWLNIAVPYITRRNYYYNCGSIPHAGQTRCVKAIQRWLKDARNKYAVTIDIRKFYDTCPHKIIIDEMRRIFKDERFIQVGIDILTNMSDSGVGIAIGYPSSHWFANLALLSIDHAVKQNFADVDMARYMDDIILVSPNKRKIKRAMFWLKGRIESTGLRLKKWNLYRTVKEGVAYLSYRFFNGYTLLRKPLMYRIASRMRKAKELFTAHIAMAVVSYFGILKYCNSYNFRQAYVYPYISKGACLSIISKQSKIKSLV